MNQLPTIKLIIILLACCEVTTAWSQAGIKSDSTHILNCQRYLDLGDDHPDLDSAVYYYKQGVDYSTRFLEANHSLLGDLYRGLGIAYKYKGENELASLFYHKALELRKIRFGEKHTKVAAIYNNLGLLYKNIGKFDESEQYFLKSLEIDKELLGPEHYEVARTLGNLALLYTDQEYLSKAAETLHLAIRIKEKELGINHNSTAFSHLNLGRVYTRQEKYSEAISSFEKARGIFLSVENPAGELVSNENIANSSFLMGDVDLSLQYYQKALSGLVSSFVSAQPEDNPRASDLPHGNVTLFVLGGKARSLLEKFKKNNSQEHIESTISTYKILFETIDDMKRQLSYPSSKQEFITKVFYEYEQAIYASYLAYEKTKEFSYLDQAFRWAEDSKSFMLLESLRDDNAKFVAAIPNEIKAEEEGLLENIGELKNQIYKLEQGKDPDINQLTDLKNQQLQVSLAYEAFLKKTAIDYPNYYKLKYQDTRLSLVDIQEKMVDQNNAIVEYFKGANHLFAFYIDKQQASFHHQGIDNRFNDQINHLVDAVKVNQSTPQSFATASKELYDILIAPLQIDDNIKHLNIVPDGVINYIPFEVLAKASNFDNFQQASYLVQDYSISYLYSTTIGLETLKNQKVVTDGKYLAFAPDFNTRNDTDQSVDQSLAFNEPVRGSLAELKGTYREVSVISNLIKGQFYEGSGASELRFKQQAGDFSIIHLATHAIIDNDNPMNSRLLFTIDDDTTEDGDLHAWELYNMQINAQMAVLSACNTGSGQVQKGEGVMSLGRAFAYAGCPSIVMSLWPAQDQSTADIMTYFYQGLSKGYSKDEALRKAKLKYLENADDLFAHPFYWAGFVVQGDPSPITLSKGVSYWWILICGLLIFMVVGAALYFKRRNLPQ